MKKREIPVMNVGISLIILIFMNICLAAFAVLSLENAVSVAGKFPRVVKSLKIVSNTQ